MIEKQLYEQGVEKARQKDYAGAIADLTEAIQLSPYFADAYYQRGLAYFDTGNLHDAVSDYTRALEFNPESVGARYARALVRLTLKNLPGALEDVDAAIARDEKYAAAYNLRGMVQRKQGNIHGAIAAFKKAGELYLAQKDAENCRRCLERAKQLQPKSPQPTPQAPPQPLLSSDEIYAQILTKAESGDCRGAMRELDWAIELDDKDANAYCCRGIIRSKMGDSRGAIADFNRALRLNPEDAIAYRNRGKLRMELGDWGGAASDFNRAIEIEPKDAMLLVARGNAFREMGNYSAAIDDYTQALEIDAEDANAYYHRGMARARMEEMKGAIEDYQNAASYFCEKEDWKNYQNALDSLKQLQSAAPQTKAAEVNSNPLRDRLLILVGGHWGIAERLIERAKYYYPGMSEDWYIEKVVYDLEQQRGGNG